MSLPTPNAKIFPDNSDARFLTNVIAPSIDLVDKNTGQVLHLVNDGQRLGVGGAPIVGGLTSLNGDIGPAVELTADDLGAVAIDEAGGFSIVGDINAGTVTVTNDLVVGGDATVGDKLTVNGRVVAREAIESRHSLGMTFGTPSQAADASIRRTGIAELTVGTDLVVPGVLAVGNLPDVEQAIEEAGGSIPEFATFKSVIAEDPDNYESLVSVVSTHAGGSRFAPPLVVKAAGTGGFGVQKTSDTRPRVSISPDGIIDFSPGNASFDVSLFRDGPSVLRTPGTLRAGNMTVDGTTTVSTLNVNGQFNLNVPMVVEGNIISSGTVKGGALQGQYLLHGISGGGGTVGFYGKSPVARQASIAAATDGASAVDAVNSVITVLNNLGLIG